MLICTGCNTPLETKDRRQKYCSPECKAAHQALKQKKDKQKLTELEQIKQHLENYIYQLQVNDIMQFARSLVRDQQTSTTRYFTDDNPST